MYSISYRFKKKSHIRFENLKITPVNRKNISKFTVAQGLARVKPALELNTFLWENPTSIYVPNSRHHSCLWLKCVTSSQESDSFKFLPYSGLCSPKKENREVGNLYKESWTLSCVLEKHLSDGHIPPLPTLVQKD